MKKTISTKNTTNRTRKTETQQIGKFRDEEERSMVYKNTILMFLITHHGTKYKVRIMT